MTLTTNSAHRIFLLMNEALKKPDNKPTSEVWALLLDVDEAVKQDTYKLYNKLNLVCEEIEKISRVMSHMGIHSSLYSPYLKKALNTASVNNLSADWGVYKKNLQPDVMLCLRYCAELIPDEDAIQYEILSSAYNQVQKLREEVHENKISGDTLTYLMSQTDIIEKAINEYIIKGPEGINKAFGKGFIDLVVYLKDLKINYQTVEVKKLSIIWELLKENSNEDINNALPAKALLGLIKDPARVHNQ